MARNPDYKGQFSAVAHSLGCVILYDIITGHKIGCERCISRVIINLGHNALIQLILLNLHNCSRILKPNRIRKKGFFFNCKKFSVSAHLWVYFYR